MIAGLSVRYPQVEELVARLHSVPASSRTMLRARFKHFKRVGFPEGVNTGRGHPAWYTAHLLAELLLAFELMQAGLSLEHSVRLLHKHPAIASTAEALAGGLMPPPDALFDPKALSRSFGIDDLTTACSRRRITICVGAVVEQARSIMCEMNMIGGEA